MHMHVHTRCWSVIAAIPESADEAIGGALRVQRADVANVQEAGHLVRHVRHTGQENLQKEKQKMRFGNHDGDAIRLVLRVGGEDI